MLIPRQALLGYELLATARAAATHQHPAPRPELSRAALGRAPKALSLPPKARESHGACIWHAFAGLRG